MSWKMFVVVPVSVVFSVVVVVVVVKGAVVVDVVRLQKEGERLW